MQKDLTYGLDALAVTPNDGADLVRPNPGLAAQPAGAKALVNCCSAISVGAAGTVKITDGMGNQQTLTFNNVGQYFVRAVRIWNTGTSATGIVAYFPIYD